MSTGTERTILERRIDELRAFEREYHSRLIATHEDCLATLQADEGAALLAAVKRVAGAADGDLAGALRLLGPGGRQRLITALLRHPVEETTA